MTTQAPGLQEDYAYETCGLCKGIATLESQAPCPPCNATGKVLVHQPPIRCPRCKGSGKPATGDFYLVPVCVVCRGAGWALAVLD